MPSLIVVAESDTDEPSAFSHDRRSFQLKERVSSSDVSDPHLAAQLIQRIGWALADSVLWPQLVRAGRLGEGERLSPRFIWMAATLIIGARILPSLGQSI